MGVLRLQTFMEQWIGPEGFRSVSIEDLKNQYEKENPGSPIELLWDVECCLRFIYRANSVEFRFGGENVTLVQLLKNFFDKFKSLGIKVVSFYGNYTSKKKRSEWVRRRYETLGNVFKILNQTERNQLDDGDESLFVIPPGLCFTSMAIIKHVLKEKVIQSLTENDIEIITYARKNKSFAILSQDSDFIIADVARYYISMKHLDFDTMRTYLYDAKVLAKVHNLKPNQLPLFATLLGTDLMEFQALQEYHNMYFFRKKNGRIDLSYFFCQAAKQCQHIKCDSNNVPIKESDLVRLIRQIRGRGSQYGFEELYRMMMESIQSFQVYEIEKEMYLSNVKDEQSRETLKFALLLYRQGWITSDLLMLLCSQTTEMSTCLEIFDYFVKPIGIVLKNLRATLYSATFNGDSRVEVQEFVITREGCFDRSVPRVRAAQTANVRPLLEVWQSNLEQDSNSLADFDQSFDPKLQLDNVLFKAKDGDAVNKRKEYLVNMFCQSCPVSAAQQVALLAQFKSGLPPAVHLPLFIFIYLEGDSHAYLDSSERDAVLFTFSTVAVLSVEQVEAFAHPLLVAGAKVPVIRAANLFRRGAQVMINFNAVCGFPIPVEWVDGHNFWQGSFMQRFHSFLYDSRRTQTELYQVIIEALLKLDDSSLLPRYNELMRGLSQLNLFNSDLTERLKSTNDSDNTNYTECMDSTNTSHIDCTSVINST